MASTPGLRYVHAGEKMWRWSAVSAPFAHITAEKRTVSHTHNSLPPSYTMHSQMRSDSSNQLVADWLEEVVEATRVEE